MPSATGQRGSSHIAFGCPRLSGVRPCPVHSPANSQQSSTPALTPTFSLQGRLGVGSCQSPFTCPGLHLGEGECTCLRAAPAQAAPARNFCPYTSQYLELPGSLLFLPASPPSSPPQASVFASRPPSVQVRAGNPRRSERQPGQDRGTSVYPPLHLEGVPHTASTWGVNSNNRPDMHLLTPVA